MAKAGTLQLDRISAHGVVQGLGFKPLVYQLVTRHNLVRCVCNTSHDIKIEVHTQYNELNRDSAPLIVGSPRSDDRLLPCLPGTESTY